MCHKCKHTCNKRSVICNSGIQFKLLSLISDLNFPDSSLCTFSFVDVNFADDAEPENFFGSSSSSSSSIMTSSVFSTNGVWSDFDVFGVPLWKVIYTSNLNIYSHK